MITRFLNVITGEEVEMDDGLPEFVPPPPTKQDLLAHAAACRWERMNAGTVISGIHAATDADSRGLINGAVSKAQLDPEFTTPFKAVSGWVVLDAETIIQLGLGVAAFMSDCFLREHTISGFIEAGEITTLEDVQAAFND